MFSRRACVWQMALTKQQSFAKHKHILQMVVVSINAIYRTQARRENIDWGAAVIFWG